MIATSCRRVDTTTIVPDAPGEWLRPPSRISSSPRTICSASPAVTTARAATAGCPRRSSDCRARRSRPTSKRAGRGEEGFFSWLSEAKLHYSKTRTGEGRLKAVKVRLCDWLFRAILPDRHVLDYAAAYFQLGPIKRRIYEVARSTCEDGPLDIDLATFRLQIGYQNPLSNFKAALKQIVATDGIPDFHLELVEETEAAPADGAAPRRGRRAPQARVIITPRPPVLGEGESPARAMATDSQ